MTVLVTGGAGFVGSHLVDCLVANGYEVTVVDNLDDQVHDGKPPYLNDDADYVWGDVRDRDLMSDLLKEADVLSHQASVVGVGQSMYEIERYTATNTLGTAGILDIIANKGIELEKMIVASSMSIYGEGQYRCSSCGQPCYPSVRDENQLRQAKWNHSCAQCDSELEPTPTPEDKPMDGTSIYAITKKTQEEMTLSIGRAYDIPSVALRYFNIYGSRQSLDNPYTGVCAILSSRIKNDNPPLIFEDGEQCRDFIHVRDIARANVAAIESPVWDEAINVGTGNPITIREVAETLIEQYGKAGEITPEIVGDYRSGDIRHCYADTTKARTLLDFEPRVNLDRGMEELVEWGREQDVEDNFEDAYRELESKGLLEN